MSRISSLPFSVRSFGAIAAGLAITAAGGIDPARAPAMPRSDPRITRLERFFEHYNCPMPYHISEYLRAADANRLDYRLLPAISVRETTCGAAEHINNHWGFHSGHQAFATVEEGIDFVEHRLARGYYYRGKNVRDKLSTYNRHRAYPREVQRIMRQIENLPIQ
jgi:hypothetical protein